MREDAWYLHQQVKILCNTIATGEADEERCYTAIDRLLSLIAIIEGTPSPDRPQEREG